MNSYRLVGWPQCGTFKSATEAASFAMLFDIDAEWEILLDDLSCCASILTEEQHMTYSKERIEECRQTLKEALAPGSTLRTVIRSVARSGMSRTISVLAVETSDEYGVEPRIRDWTAAIAIACGFIRTPENYLRVSGCGTDAGFEVVYNLGRVLFPNGFDCSGAKCHSNEHSNYHSGVELPSHTCIDHIQREPGRCSDMECVPWHHNDGGYALRQEWL